jgi:quercetin dioxygenase-like cupin family protein
MYQTEGNVMTIRNVSETSVMENAHNVYARNLYSKPEAMMTVITLKPGQSLKRHITPVDVVFYVMEGNGTVEIGDEKQEVRAATLVESPRGIVHRWHNSSKKPLRLMVVKAPRHTDKTVFVGD